MIKKQEKKIDNVLLLSITNIILLVFIFFLYDIFYIILGHPEYFLVNTRSVTLGDYAIVMRLRGIVEPYVLIGFFLASIYSMYCVNRTSKFKKHGKKHRYLYRMNILILIYYILGLFIALLNPVPFNGLLG
ncbi:MAG: hypothetical protein CVV25_10935 [Ignavibacteriae bacterium HGW-Ignavibacteriae-4]|jgi:succinate dehydrogenase hydrophobic anchor subunit|nr:MAG: hypothetical protein CVV25_10935 [Ignavibacteriae bacterium HGW-Ignavibacteriae-4]